MVSCSSSSINKAESNNIDISFSLEDSIKDIEPAIIDAAKKAIINNYNNKKYIKYNKVYVNIFEVEKKDNNWKVKFRSKTEETQSLNMNSFAFVTVEKQSSGEFKGYIINPGGPPIYDQKQTVYQDKRQE